ncbi:MAG: hypothetical protein ABFD83_12175 [Armatimonadota bacterium]
MRLLFGIILTVFVFSCSFVMAKEQIGTAILNRAGITSLDGIDSVIISSCDGIYKLTPKSNPQSMKRLYSLLSGIREDRPDAGPVGRYATLTINLASSKVVWMLFGRKPVDDRHDIITMAGGYLVPGMVEFLDDLKHDAVAAKLDSQIPQFKVKKLSLRLSHMDSVIVPESSSAGCAVIAKAQSILYSLDIRSVWAEEVKSSDIAIAQGKFGCVTLESSELFRLDITVIDSAKLFITQTGYYTDPIGWNLARKQFGCESFLVMDYGNYKPPIVVLRDRADNCYLLRDFMTRKDIESGKNSKTLAILYEELQSLTKNAYKEHAKNISGGPGK